MESIPKTSENFNIIFINNAFKDDYDYRFIADKFYTKYIEHSKRIGVAALRDKGVRICETKYFILLDAYVRVYQNDWVSFRRLEHVPYDFICEDYIFNKL